MNQMASNKMAATVLRYIDLAALLPECAGQSQLGLDVRITHGGASIGQRVKLLGPNTEARLQITGIEMFVDRSDPKVARLHCSSEKSVAIPQDTAEGWTIVEE
jgi:hypothetical protein